MSPPSPILYGRRLTRNAADNGQSTAEDPNRIVVLDGGFATQLSCHVDQPVDGDPLWSARFLATHPQAVIDTHLDFLRAGADLIMTNTYQASVGGFMEYLKLTEEESLNLITKAVNMARIACDKFVTEYPNTNRSRPLIVGSIGPYGASLHDASEYTGSYAKHTNPETMAEWHRPRIEAVLRAGVDVLALETIPCSVEAETLVELLKDYPGAKAWLSFSCRPDGKHISYGEDFQKVARKCYDMNPQQLVAVGANCLAPSLVEGLFKGINKGREHNPVPLIVYPNSGEKYNAQLGWIDRDKCEPVDVYIKTWLDLGISFVGGCCRTYAADVSRIRNEVTKWQIEQAKKTNT